MAPVLQRLVAFTVGVLLCFLLLRKMPLAIRDHFPHVLKVLFVILVRIFVGILVQNLDDLAAT